MANYAKVCAHAAVRVAHLPLPRKARAGAAGRTSYERLHSFSSSACDVVFLPLAESILTSCLNFYMTWINFRFFKVKVILSRTSFTCCFRDVYFAFLERIIINTYIADTCVIITIWCALQLNPSIGLRYALIYQPANQSLFMLSIGNDNNRLFIGAR